MDGIQFAGKIIKYANSFFKNGDNEKNNEKYIKNNIENNKENIYKDNEENKVKNEENMTDVSSLAETIFSYNFKALGLLAGYEAIKYFKRQSNSATFNEKWEKKINELINILIQKTEEKFNNSELNVSEKNRICEKSKDKIKELFDEEEEKIFNRLQNFISGNEFIKDKIQDKIEQIKHINIISLGESQIGKTELINRILILSDDKKGKVGGFAESVTMKDETFVSDILKHIQITDTRGLERGEYNLNAWLKEHKEKMIKGLKNGNFGDSTHLIWYCVNSNYLNNEEIQRIKNFSQMFEGYSIPIIFVYLKPFERDIELIKSRTNLINNNFIAVQSFDYIKKCNEFVVNCKNVSVPQKNMNKLLLLTKNLAFEGIINSMGSKVSSDLIEEMKKQFKKKIVEEIQNYISEKKQNQNNNSYDILEINQKIEKKIEILIELFEEILFGKNSNEKFSIKSRNIIFEIQKEIKSKYNNLYIKYEEDIIKEFKSQVKDEKESLHCNEKENYWFFGINELNKKEFESDLQLIEKEFKKYNLASKYSLIKSIDELYKILEENVSEIIDKKIQEIISNKSLKKKLDDTIKKICDIKIQDLIKEFDKEINIAFPKK